MRTKLTKLTIKCKQHGTQLAIATIGGEILCKECQKIIQRKK